MASLRRSQGDVSVVILSISRVSNRKIKSTKKKAFVARIEITTQIESIDELSIFIARKPSTKKDLLSDIRFSNIVGAVANASFNVNNKESRQIIKDHDARQSREVAIFNRMRAKQEKKTKV